MHAGLEQRVISTLRILPSSLLRQRNSPLRKTLEHEIVERTVRRKLHRRLDAVTRITSASTKPNHT
jgi:hypothetical protein